MSSNIAIPLNIFITTSHPLIYPITYDVHVNFPKSLLNLTAITAKSVPVTVNENRVSGRHLQDPVTPPASYSPDEEVVA